MNRRWFVLSLGMMLLGCAPGCLMVHQSTRVVREKEPLRSVRFESEQTQRLFETGAHQMQAHKDYSQPDIFALPFLCLLIRGNELSDNAVYNDQAGICDANGDGFITLQEAQTYRAGVDTKMAAIQQAKTAKHGTSPAMPDGGAITVTPQQQGPEQPPALIHISSREGESKK
jgi:hypothetical protein